jgi:hypothetical protein
MVHVRHKCTECGATWSEADLKGRGIRLLKGDQFVNNTDFELFLYDLEEQGLGCIGPGEVFDAPNDMTVSFDANMQYTFRAYLNSGYRRN